MFKFEDSETYMQGLTHLAVGKALTNPKTTMKDLVQLAFEKDLKLGISFQVSAPVQEFDNEQQED